MGNSKLININKIMCVKSILFSLDPHVYLLIELLHTKLRYITIIINIGVFYFRYLLEHGADVSAINCDQELVTDIAESEDMRQLLEQHLKDIGNL